MEACNTNHESKYPKKITKLMQNKQIHNSILARLNKIKLNIKLIKKFTMTNNLIKLTNNYLINL